MTATSRRALLGALAAAPAIAALAAVPASAAKVDRRAWEKALAVYEKATAEDAADSAVYFPIYKRCKAEVATIPHIECGPHPYGTHFPTTTADTMEVLSARRLVKNVDAGTSKLDPIPSLQEELRFARRLVAAADERDAKIAAIRARYNMDALDDRAEALGEARCEASSRLILTPAPDGAALLWKLEHLFGGENRADGEEGDAFCAAWIDALMADARRLLSTGRT